MATSLGITCYTDGSISKDLAGSGYCITGPGTLLREAELPLGKNITVFQAEVYAISQVASRLNQEAQDVSQINVYVDCKSALDSLTSEAPQGQLVRECAARLNALASNRLLMLHWIPAHKGYSGNELVDRLAKIAAETSFLGPEPSIPISTETVNSAIDATTEPDGEGAKNAKQKLFYRRYPVQAKQEPVFTPEPGSLTDPGSGGHRPLPACKAHVYHKHHK